MAAAVVRLRTTPVKGLAQEERKALSLLPGGVVDDRRFVIAEGDRVLWSAGLDPLARATARWEPGPDPGDVDAATNGALELRLGDGSQVAGEVVLGAPVAGRAFADRPVPGRVVHGPFAEALSDVLGRPVRLLFVAVGVGAPGPVTLLGDGSLARLAAQLGLDALDPRRFRMTIEVEGLSPHEEDGWDGRRVRLGDAVVAVSGQVPRCALTTRDPDTRARDLDTLRALLAYRTATAGGDAPLGVYARVVAAGAVRRGDIVTVLP